MDIMPPLAEAIHQLGPVAKAGRMRGDVRRPRRGHPTLTFRSGWQQASRHGHYPVLKRRLCPFSEKSAFADPVFIMPDLGAVSSPS
jgi:hypothetical protein